MDAKKLSASIAQFSWKFCNELQKDKSVVSSPLSAEFVLALLTLGTTEPSHSELLSSLGIPDDDSIHSAFGTISSKLKSVKGVTLNVANKVYIMDGGYELQDKLKKDAVKVFDAGLEKIDFGNAAAASYLINKWVEGKTNNKIKDLLSADSLNSDTRLVLVNALYFKGTWAKQFNPRSTKDQPFHVNASTTIDVPMMNKEANYRYGESHQLNAQLLELQYVGGDASMLIVLPKEIEGLNGVLKKLADGYDLNADLKRMNTSKVRVSIPKFKIETEIDLGTLLPKLGIKAIFNPENSGLTKLLNSAELLYVSKAVQKAFIEVNEEGAEAAAATAGYTVMVCRSMPITLTFRADRPFLYTLNGPDGTAYFVGVYRGNALVRRPASKVFCAKINRWRGWLVRSSR